MMLKPKVTVYIASHNYGKFLEQAVESTLRQTCDNWELLIINDNSSDNTAEIMKLYQGDDRIRQFHTLGLGLPGVCNLALKEARGEYLIRLDGDDFFDENILLVLANYLDRNPEIAMVFPDFFYVEEDGTIFAHERRERIFENNHLLDNPANGACNLVRKSILEKEGGYRMDLGAQDGYDLWNKLLAKYRVANINIPLFYYRRHGRNLTNKTKYILNARRQIKKDNVIAKLEQNRPIIFVIPCRKNYDFCSNVWQRKILNETLLDRDIRKCLASPLVDQVVVASDDESIEKLLAKYKDPRIRFFKRTAAETIRSVSISKTLGRIAEVFDPDSVGIMVLSYLQAPFVTTETMEEAVNTLLLNDADSSMGVEEIQDALFQRGPHGLNNINPAKSFSSDFDTIYRESKTALALRTENLNNGSIRGASIVNFIVSKEECFFVGSEQNLKISEIIAEQQ